MLYPVLIVFLFLPGLPLRLLQGDYTAADVPPDILALVILDDQIYADVVKAGGKVGTGLTEEVR